jgi:hypothetical protein
MRSIGKYSTMLANPNTVSNGKYSTMLANPNTVSNSKRSWPFLKGDMLVGFLIFRNIHIALKKTA